MSVERSFEVWEEVQRHGQDLADWLVQGFTGIIQSHIANPPSFSWPDLKKSKLFDLEFPIASSTKRDLAISVSKPDINGVLAIFDIGHWIGQAGADFGACLKVLVYQFYRQLPVPFKHEESGFRLELNGIDSGLKRSDAGLSVEESFIVREKERERLIGVGAVENDGSNNVDEETGGLDLPSAAHLGRPQGIINISSTYDSRTHDLESSLIARGDLWRIEVSNGCSTSGNNNSSLFLVQLGPVLYVRDSTLLLPVHLSKQHLLWYGYDRKNGMHSICPALWSKHRRWLLMSMLCLNPLACSFVDLQFPNGQLTYVSGEGLTTSAFLPLCGGLLQAQGQYPGEMRLSFSSMSKWGARVTPMVQWPDKSFTLGLAQALAWKRSGLMVRPTIQFSFCPTFGGSNPGFQAELIHSLKEELSLIYGYTCMTHPSAFASVSIGRSNWNGNVGNSGIVMRIDAPLSSVGRPSFSVQINTGIEF
ncbi:uncharacterized protein LOC123201482 [Mangifera indica]|uniref:uncharacterized protein LOC123201482 n=1 Tax=Mangifera indica TaxID=29780 RepID=UPI001CFA106C|nr:uncharacterized protein LOC123201482 [Mangifera indica]